MIITKQVNIYVQSSIKGLKRQNGVVGYVLETKKENGQLATLTDFAEVENMTANQSELAVVVMALKRLRMRCNLIIFTDSDYVAAGYKQGWIGKWLMSNWKTAKGKDIANKNEWQDLYLLLNEQAFEFKVKEDNQYKSWLISEVNRKKTK